MLVYAQHESIRLQYILQFISKELFSEAFHLTTDQKVFCSYNGPKINYSPAKISDNEFWILNTNLLFESGVREQALYCFEINGYKAFFGTITGDFFFDLLAAAFYLISRYEEYLPHSKDAYGRYAHINSLAYKENFLHLPLINIWLSDFKQALLRKYPGMKFNSQSFAYLPTYDIDIAWSYNNKGWWRNTGGLLRSAIQKDWYRFKERIQVIFKKNRDPFDSYEWLHNIYKRNKLKPIYFFLIASKQKGSDKNISPLNNDLQALIKYHASLYTTGIHPSWQSGDDDFLLSKEITHLEQIASHKIIHSRQHYIRFSLPTTYQKLIRAGIQKEYSMGYGTINGFRASVASSFYWFDLENEAITCLRVYPFCFMDASAYYELKLSPAHALEQLLSFYKIIKELNGLMITIWHNNFLGTDPAFEGWRDVYETFLKEIKVLLYNSR